MAPAMLLGNIHGRLTVTATFLSAWQMFFAVFGSKRALFNAIPGSRERQYVATHMRHAHLYQQASLVEMTRVCIVRMRIC